MPLAAGWDLLPAVFTSSEAVRHQAHILWPWFVAMEPPAGLVFALDGVLIGAGDMGFMRTITLVAALGAFVPINVAALHWHWGIGGVWAGLFAFIMVRLAGMLRRIQGGRWTVLGEQIERILRNIHLSGEGPRCAAGKVHRREIIECFREPIGGAEPEASAKTPR